MADKLPDDIIQYLKCGQIRHISKALFEKFSFLITYGKLPSGFVLPNENVMCELLGIGRSTLREAYTALAVFGYITRSNSGTKINDMNEAAKFTPFSITLESSDINDLLEFRFMLEAEIARYAALRATDDEIQKMYEENEYMKSCIDDFKSFAKYDAQFHMHIARASHNKLLINTMLAAKDSIEKGIRQAVAKASGKNREILVYTVKLHGDLIDAIKNKDVMRSTSIMKEHISYVNATMQYR